MRVLSCLLLVFFSSLYQKGLANFPYSPDIFCKTPHSRQFLQKNDSLFRPKPKDFFQQASFSFNILSAINSEFGFLFESGRINHKFSLIIPFSFGFGNPIIQNKVNRESNGGEYTADPVKKLADIGLGINIYLNKKLNSPSFIGFCCKVMQYDCTESWRYPNWVYLPSNYLVYDQTTLTRYAATLNTGLTIPFQSRIRITLMAMFGIRYDTISDRITDPITMTEVPNFDRPWYPYFNATYCLGYVF